MRITRSGCRRLQLLGVHSEDRSSVFGDPVLDDLVRTAYAQNGTCAGPGPVSSRPGRNDLEMVGSNQREA
jgi:hypothetical protein